MEPRPGISGNPRTTFRKPGLLEWAGRVTGFLLLAAPALAIAAAMILLPAYKNLEQNRYELACLEVVKQEKEDFHNTRARLISRLPYDDSLTWQLVQYQSDLVPANGEIVVDPTKPRRSPLRVTVPSRERPQPPMDRWITLANTIEPRQIKWGLGLMALAGLAGGLLLFSPARDSLKQE